MPKEAADFEPIGVALGLSASEGQAVLEKEVTEHDHPTKDVQCVQARQGEINRKVGAVFRGIVADPPYLGGLQAHLLPMVVGITLLRGQTGHRVSHALS